MKHPFQKLTALLCAVFMLASLLPVQTFAAEEPTFYGVLQRGNPLYPATCEDDFTYISSDTPSLLIDSSVLNDDLPSFATVEEAGAYVRAALKARDEGVVFFYTDIPADGPFAELTEEEANAAYSEDEQALIDNGESHEYILITRRFSKYMGNLLVEILEAAFRHDATDPTGGDYLLYQFGSLLLGYSYDGSTLGIELHFTYYTTTAQEAEVDTVAAELIDYLVLDGKSDYEKLKAIYTWICDNVNYDSVNLNDSDYTLKYSAYAALIDKTAVCQGYAVLLYRLALMAGIDARVVTGTAKGGGHAWNIVKLDGKWYHVDATWDAGVSTPAYYLLPGFNDHTLDDDGNAVVNQYPMAETAYTPVSRTPGDLNGQNELDITDIQLLYTYLTTGSTGETTLSENDFRLIADVNHDSSVDVYDLQWLYEFVSTQRT